MNLIAILRRMENNIKILIKELESRSMENLAQSVQSIIMKMKAVEKMFFFTYGIAKVFKELSEEMKNLSNRVKEEPSSIFEGLKGFARTTSEVMPNVLSKYTRLKTLILFLSIVYTVVAMSFANVYIAQSIASITTHLLLCLGLILIIAMTLDLALSLFIIPLIPFTSIISLILSIEPLNQPKILVLTLHFTALFISLIFITKSIKEYNIIKKSLTDIMNCIEDIIEILRSTKLEKPSSADLSAYAEIYGDKVFELIKYVNDMQKLSG